MFSFNSVELETLESGNANIGVFFRLDTEPEPVRLWLGFGSIESGINVLDSSGAEYKGFGEIRDIPTFKQLLNGAAERVEFTLSGVSGEVLDKAQSDAESVKRKDAAVGFALMAPDWSLLGSVHWVAFYVADYLSISQAVVDDPSGQIVRTIELSCGSRFTGRRRPSFSYFSNQDQQARFPGDKACSLTPNYAHGFNKTWPIFS